jgi:hypothetical protein
MFLRNSQSQQDAIIDSQSHHGQPQNTPLQPIKTVDLQVIISQSQSSH